MRARFAIAVLAGVLLLVAGTPATAKRKAASDSDTTYLGCLKRGMAAASQADPAGARTEVLADCIFLRRATATVTEALLLLDGGSAKRANAKVEEMMAADDEEGLGISRQDSVALFTAYDALEKELAAAKGDYQIHADGKVGRVITQSSGDPAVDAIRCMSVEGCPALDAKPGANNDVAFRCIATEQARQLLLLGVSRLKLPSFAASDGATSPGR
jgi:hypothetical protein